MTKSISIFASIFVLAVMLQSAIIFAAQEKNEKEDAKEKAIPPIAEKIEGMQRFDGYLSLIHI